MTPQEVSNFVNQPTPRKIPKNILHTVLHAENLFDEHRARLIGWFLLLFFFLLVFFCLQYSPTPAIRWAIKDFPLDIGNKKTTQGTVISLEQKAHRSRRYGSSKYYHLVVRFSTPKGEVTANCYVYNVKRITGWGIIPESRGERASDLFARLKAPFPVPVAYIPWYPSIARAVGTRASLDSEALYILTLITLGLAAKLHTSSSLHNYRRCKRILKKGRFVTGRVLEIRARPMETNARYVCDVMVSFSDQCFSREGYCEVPWYAKSKCSQWPEGRSVGLLYLPDVENVLITDLWVDD